MTHHIHGPKGVNLYTCGTVVTTRWPEASGLREHHRNHRRFPTAL